MSKFKYTVAAIALGLSTSANAVDTGPYVGADYFHTWMKGKGDFRPHLDKNYNGASINAGYNFLEYLGVEVGYDWNFRESRDANATVVIPALANAVNDLIHMSAKLRGPYIDLVGHLPLRMGYFDEHDCFDLIGLVGVSSKKLRTKVAINGVEAATDDDRRALWRLGAGAKWKFSEYVGVRGLFRWENTRRLRTDVPATMLTVKPVRNSYSLDLGLFVSF